MKTNFRENNRKIIIDSNWSPRITPKQAFKFATVTPNDVAVSFSVATNKETIVQPSNSKTMDLTEEKVSFDQMPAVVSELKQEISGLKTLVRTLIDAAAADVLATCIFEAAKKYLPDMQMRTDYSGGDPDFEESFYILRHSLCPAVFQRTAS